MNLKPKDKVYWKDKAGEVRIGTINRQRANVIWEILGDDGEPYAIEEERLRPLVLL
jgi:hypothetical protein